MSNNKWRVTRYKKYWCVTPPPGWEEAYEWSSAWWNEDAGLYSTWQRAMQEADRRARTIEITLPPATSRAVLDAGRGYTTYVNWDSHGWAWLESDGAIFPITDLEREALALHLLAHHYRKARA